MNGDNKNILELLGKTTTRFEVITPDLAKDYLAKNTQNRRNNTPNERVVRSYMDDMKNGLWKINGSTIVFGESGRLLDGQHRLMACVKSGISFVTLVVRGIRDDVFDTIDIGLARTGGDLLSIIGAPNYTAASSIIIGYDMLHRGNKLGMNGEGRSRDASMTKAGIVSFYEKNKSIVDEVASRAKFPNHNAKSRFYNLYTAKQIGSTALYLILDKGHDIDVVFSFFRQVCSSDDVENNTVRLLRDRLIKHKMGSPRLTTETINAITRITWNCYITGRQVKVLRYNPTQEEFPKFL